LGAKARAVLSTLEVVTQPLQSYIPLFGAMASTKVLQVVNDRNSLRLDSPEEVVLDRVLAARRLVVNHSSTEQGSSRIDTAY
jgi:hypothetical protein